MHINWGRLVPTVIGLYFVGVGVFGVMTRRMPMSMTRGIRVSIVWRSGRTAVLYGAWCLALGFGIIGYSWLH